MTPDFDKGYWESHWREVDGRESQRPVEANPYLALELSGVSPGSALDAGSGEGGEAMWLATTGWAVTAVDISSRVLRRAAHRARSDCPSPERVTWVEADLSVWEPNRQFDLVTTHYAHPSIAQLDFYLRLSRWVAPGGTLLIVAHLHTSGATDDADHHRDGSSVTSHDITESLDLTQWVVVTAEEPARILKNRAGESIQLNDVVVRANRRT